jgi:hypothetical protein
VEIEAEAPRYEGRLAHLQEAVLDALLESEKEESYEAGYEELGRRGPPARRARARGLGLLAYLVAGRAVVRAEWLARGRC